MSLPPLSRRRVVAGAAWAAPAVVLVAAAPATAAASTSPSGLLIVAGRTSSVPADDTFFNLDYQGFRVEVPGSLAAGGLMLVAGFAPAAGLTENRLIVLDDPSTASPWTISPVVGGTAASVTMLYGAAITGATSVKVPDVDYVGTYLEADVENGAFVLTAIASGYTSDTASFATGPAPAARGTTAAGRGAPRHR